VGAIHSQIICKTMQYWLIESWWPTGHLERLERLDDAKHS